MLFQLLWKRPAEAFAWTPQLKEIQWEFVWMTVRSTKQPSFSLIICFLFYLLMTCNIFTFFSHCCFNNYMWHFCNCNFFFRKLNVVSFSYVSTGRKIGSGSRMGHKCRWVKALHVNHVSRIVTKQVWLDLWLKSSEFLMKDVVFLWTGLTLFIFYWLLVNQKPLKRSKSHRTTS